MENDGLYSVRSAYKNNVISAGLQQRHGITGGWNLIWKAKIPPNVKNLLWRIGRNILPTRVRLNSRGVQCSVICALCSEENEDSNHVLFQCLKSIRCWQQAGLWMHISACVNANNNITGNLFSILQWLDKIEQQLFSVMVWSIWKCRNNQVWNNISDTARTVYERASHLLTSWCNAQEARALVDLLQQSPPQTVWTKPRSSRYKCNVDASFSYLHNKLGIGMCIRDEQGCFVKAKIEWLEPILDVEIGEAMGLLSALKWIEELSLYDTNVEVDCKRVVDGLYSKRSFNSDFGAILSDRRTLLATNLMNINVKFIRRQANEVAHNLAWVATSLTSFHIFTDIPTCIYDIIMNEMR